MCPYSPLISADVAKLSMSTVVTCPGPGCIKQLKIKWEFLQPFPVLWRILLPAFMDKSTEGGLKSIGNTMTVRKNLPEHRNHCRNSHVILSCFMQPGSGLSR